MGGEDAAGAVREGDLGAGDLPGTALTAQLAGRLDQQQDAELAGVAVGQATAGRVERQSTAGSDPAVLDERRSLTLTAETRAPRG